MELDGEGPGIVTHRPQTLFLMFTEGDTAEVRLHSSETST